MDNLIKDPRKTFVHQHKFLVSFGIIWFAFWVINSLTSFKTFSIGTTLWSVGTLTYPIVYIFNDIFTEVYGYRVSRKVIWSGFLAFFFACSRGLL